MESPRFLRQIISGVAARCLLRAAGPNGYPIEKLDSADFAQQATTDHHRWRLDNCRPRPNDFQFAQLFYAKIDPPLMG
ncbi:MAG TPA: hypothetical protein VNE42_09500 [Acidimicrobiales bacterium]|nr:hypothetical protein [Acidimicrobiales bacterium]